MPGSIVNEELSESLARAAVALADRAAAAEAAADAERLATGAALLAFAARRIPIGFPAPAGKS